MNKRNKKIRKGLSLVEIASSSVVLMVVVLGTANFRYYATLDVEKSKKHLNAVELAASVLHSWQGVSGSETFNPINVLSSDIDISSGIGSDQPEGYNLVGKYDLLYEDSTYHITTSYKDYDSNLRQINVIVLSPFGNEENQKTFQMTNYVYME